jgi:hypothetical protein
VELKKPGETRGESLENQGNAFQERSKEEFRISPKPI